MSSKAATAACEVDVDLLHLRLMESYDEIALHFLRTAPVSHISEVAGDAFDDCNATTRAHKIAVLASRYQQRRLPLAESEAADFALDTSNR